MPGYAIEGARALQKTKDIQVYGEPNEDVLGMIKQLSQSSVPIIVNPLHLAGFTR